MEKAKFFLEGVEIEFKNSSTCKRIEYFTDIDKADAYFDEKAKEYSAFSEPTVNDRARFENNIVKMSIVDIYLPAELFGK